MKIVQVPAVLLLFAAMAATAMADTIVLNNGDRLTGTIESSDGKEITLKTDYAGEMKVKWSDVKEATTQEVVYVVKKDKTTVNGTMTTEGSEVTIHPANGNAVVVSLSDVAIMRSPAGQKAYESTLHPSLLQEWSGGADLGFALARGNSDTTNLAVGFNADRKTLSDEIKAYLSTIYSTTGAIAGGTVTANEILGGIRYDKNLNPKLFVFVAGDFTHNALQSLNVQQIYSGGLGWHVINRTDTTLDALGGINYTRESYNGPTAAGANTTVDRNFPALTLGEDFTKKLGTTSALKEDFTFYPDLSDTSEYRFAFDAGWTTQIKKWLGWQIAFGDRYISNPPILGTKSNDLVLSTGLKFSFATK